MTGQRRNLCAHTPVLTLGTGGHWSTAKAGVFIIENKIQNTNCLKKKSGEYKITQNIKTYIL